MKHVTPPPPTLAPAAPAQDDTAAPAPDPPPRSDDHGCGPTGAAVGSAAGALPSRCGAERGADDLEALREQNRLLLDSVAEGIYGLDADGNTTFINPAAERMLGWRAEELLGRRQHELMHTHRSDGSPYPSAECSIYATVRDGRTRHVVDEVMMTITKDSANPVSAQDTKSRAVTLRFIGNT